MEIYKNKSLASLNGEIWKEVDGFPYYMISNMGRVKSLPKFLRRGNLGGGVISKERIKSQRLTHGGYLITDLHLDKKKSKRPDKPYGKGGIPFWQIGEKYGVCAVTVKHILDRTKWKHI